VPPPGPAGPRAGCCLLSTERPLLRSRPHLASRRDGAVLDDDDITGLLVAFRTVQAAEAWELHGRGSPDPGALHPDVEARFRAGASVTRERGSAPPR